MLSQCKSTLPSLKCWHWILHNRWGTHNLRCFPQFPKIRWRGLPILNPKCKCVENPAKFKSTPARRKTMKRTCLLFTSNCSHQRQWAWRIPYWWKTAVSLRTSFAINKGKKQPPKISSKTNCSIWWSRTKRCSRKQIGKRPTKKNFSTTRIWWRREDLQREMATQAFPLWMRWRISLTC